MTCLQGFRKEDPPWVWDKGLHSRSIELGALWSKGEGVPAGETESKGRSVRGYKNSVRAVLGLVVEDCPALPHHHFPLMSHQSLLKLLSEVSLLRVKNCALEILGSCSCPLLADHSGKATK